MNKRSETSTTAIVDDFADAEFQVDPRCIIYPEENPTTDFKTPKSFKASRPIREQVIAAIVAAHPNPRHVSNSDADRQFRARDLEVRIRAAYKALFGEEPRHSDDIDDTVALLAMASNRRAPSGSHLSVSQLAARAAAKTAGQSTAATIERLRKKYPDRKEFFDAVVRESDFIREAIEHGILEQVRDLLAFASIEMCLPPAPLGYEPPDGSTTAPQ